MGGGGAAVCVYEKKLELGQSLNFTKDSHFNDIIRSCKLF